MSIALLALKSFRNRKVSVTLSIASIALSVALLLGVDILRHEAKSSFVTTVSGTDLIVGARSGSINLLLYSVFRIGNPTNNIAWSSYAEIRSDPAVKWSIPLSMGDSHRGFRVLGTDDNYFEHYRYAGVRRLQLSEGSWFTSDNEAVLGAEVAASLGYRLGAEIIVAHGAGDESFITHDDEPFHVVGILAPTATPVDRAVHISLDGFDHMHANWQAAGDEHGHDPLRGLLPGTRSIDNPEHSEHDEHDDHETHRAGEQHADHEMRDGGRQISAFLLGLESRAAAIGLQRKINQFEPEPLSAILPGVTLLELWEIVGLVENTLFAISVFVIVVGLFSMVIILMASINERRREMAVLRAMGARPGYIFSLILGEAVAITLAGIALGILIVYALLLSGQGWIASEFGLYLGLNLLRDEQVYLLLLVTLFGSLAGLIPGIRIYRYSLIDGMTVRS